MRSIVEIRPPVHIGDFVDMYGENSDIDANTGADEDVIALGGDKYFPSSVVAAADIDIASSSVEDDPDKGGATPGTGVHSIRIEGVDENYAYQSEVVALNGTADVHPTLDYLFINNIETVGTGTGQVNAGNITVDDGAGNVLAYMPAGEGKSLAAAYVVPSDYRGGWLLSVWASMGDSGTVTYAVCRLQTRPHNCGWRTRKPFQVSNTVPFVYKYISPLYLPPQTYVRLRVVDASADNVAIAGGFEIYLEQ